MADLYQAERESFLERHLGKKPIEMEDTELWTLIQKGSKASTKAAWRLLGTMEETEVKRRSSVDSRTYLHQVVEQATDAFRIYGDINHLIPLIYRLALKGVMVNAQNSHGNTCLHLACLRPHAETLCPHLIRIGADPCILNQKGCRIIHTYRNHLCQLVKGQVSARSGLWNAVENEDLVMVEKLMKSWCRVNIRKDKSLRQVADETSNSRLSRMLERYEAVNELVCSAFACDCERVRALYKQSRLNITQRDEAWPVPKTLVVSLRELGQWTLPVVNALRDLGSDDSTDNYEEEFRANASAFENSEFFQLLETGTRESLLRAADLVQSGGVDVAQRSCEDGRRRGWTYLHCAVDRYLRLRPVDEETARLIVTAMYRLALAGVDVNARDNGSQTALVKAAAAGEDQLLLNHLIRLGIDASLADDSGRCVSEEVYEGRGKLVFGNKFRTSDLPGIWASVRSNDIGKTERWLRSWSRVNVTRGDRKLIDVARSLQGHEEIVRLLVSYEQINEFVCATFASDLQRMKDILALGSGKGKVNTIDDFFHVGFTWNRYAEFIPRPIIITSFELCTPPVVDFLLKFGADLSKQYEESAPCGPTAFWAFRDHISNDIAAVVARHVDVKVKDEFGCTLLHRIVQKNRPTGKTEVISILLERGVEVAARDYEGSTARDYITIYRTENASEIRQMIDNYVLELVNADQSYKLETLLLESYDHIVDIRGTKRAKTAQEIAELKQYQQVLRFLREHDKYKNEIDQLQEAAKNGDLLLISKLSGERRCVWARDKGGRSLLHNAVLFGHVDVVKFLVEQHHHLVNSRDNMNRTPLHICVCLKDRHLIWPLLQDAGADPNLVDVNNMSVYDYVRQLENPTPTKNKPRGRRARDYKPSDLVEAEREMKYGVKVETYAHYDRLLTALEASASNERIDILDTVDLESLLSYGLNVSLLTECVKLKRDEAVIFLIREKDFPHDFLFEVLTSDGVKRSVSLAEYAELQERPSLVNFLKSIS